MSATPITNQWLARNREKVLTNTAAYNAETPLVGRKDALGWLKRALVSRRGPSCITISDLLGAGKTSLYPARILPALEGAELAGGGADDHTSD